MEAIIIDDEKNARESLAIQLKKYCPKINIIGTAISVADGLAKIKSLKPQLVFLDIQMPDGTGFDLLKQLTDINFQFIFVTAFDEYAIKAFQFSAVDYLLKPIQPTLLIDAVEKASLRVDYHLPIQQLQVLESNNDKIEQLIISTENDTHILPLKNIVRCQSDNYYTIFYLQDGKKIIASKTLKEYATILEEINFLRVHQSHLINLSYIKDYKFGTENYVVLKNNEKIEISRRRKKLFLEKISQ